jgi:hypothetical protein
MPLQACQLGGLQLFRSRLGLLGGQDPAPSVVDRHGELLGLTPPLKSQQAPNGSACDRA